MKIDPAILKPGDSILYRPSSLIGVIIAIKTFSWTSHIEGYVGGGMAVGARQGGVELWPLRNDKYVCGVLRPNVPFDLAAAMDWFNREAKGDKYWVSGLFGFYAPKDVKDQDETMNYKAEFCSMLVDLWYQHGGAMMFAPGWPSTKIAPTQFWQTPHMEWVWTPRAGLIAKD